MCRSATSSGSCTQWEERRSSLPFLEKCNTRGYARGRRSRSSAETVRPSQLEVLWKRILTENSWAGIEQARGSGGGRLREPRHVEHLLITTGLTLKAPCFTKFPRNIALGQLIFAYGAVVFEAWELLFAPVCGVRIPGGLYGFQGNVA